MKKTSPSHGSEDSEDGVCMTEAECGLHFTDGGNRGNQEKNLCHKLEIHIQAIHGEVPEYALLAVHGGLQCEFFCMIFPFYI